MHNTGNKKVVCVTGYVWTGSRSAPRRLLVRDGFIRPTWFTTSRPMTDAQYRQISKAQFHLARARKNVLAFVRYRGGFIGVMRDDFDVAMNRSSQGVLVAGAPEIAAQVAEQFSSARVFALKGPRMDVPDHLEATERSGQLHVIDVDVLAPSAWTNVHASIMEIIGLPYDA